MIIRNSKPLSLPAHNSLTAMHEANELTVRVTVELMSSSHAAKVARRERTFCVCDGATPHVTTCSQRTFVSLHLKCDQTSVIKNKLFTREATKAGTIYIFDTRKLYEDQPI